MGEINSQFPPVGELLTRPPPTPLPAPVKLQQRFPQMHNQGSQMFGVEGLFEIWGSTSPLENLRTMTWVRAAE